MYSSLMHQVATERIADRRREAAARRRARAARRPGRPAPAACRPAIGESMSPALSS
jgi:hypothetical protein